MKNKRKVIVVFMLLAVLCLGIGYAALVDDLYIDGKVSVDVDGNGADSEDEDNSEISPFEEDFSQDVYFKNAKAAETGVTATIGTDKNNQANDKLTITVADTVLTSKGDSTTITVDVMNDSEDYDVTIVPQTVNSDEANFEIECKWTTATDDVITTTEGSQNMTITITLITALTEDIDAEAFEITYSATASVASTN